MQKRRSPSFQDAVRAEASRVLLPARPRRPRGLPTRYFPRYRIETRSDLSGCPASLEATASTLQAGVRDSRMIRGRSPHAPREFFQGVRSRDSGVQLAAIRQRICTRRALETFRRATQSFSAADRARRTAFARECIRARSDSRTFLPLAKR